MNNYYFETSSGYNGWKKAETDHKVIRAFAHYRSVKVWRVARDGTKTLILNKKR